MGRTMEIKMFKKLDYRDLIIFLIPFAIFMYFLYVFNPGILTFDSYHQLHQIADSTFSNWHPFFHTFIEMLCLKVYADPKAICIFQILTFSTIWTIICKYHRKDDVKSKNFILQVVITLIISLIPINALYSITLWKDILFSYFLLLVCFLIEVLIDRDMKVGYVFCIILSLAMAFVAQLRPNGLIVILMLLAIFSVYLFKKNRDKKLHILIPALTIIFILLISSLNVVYEVKDTQKDAVFDKTTHILSFYDLNVNMSHEDRQKVHEMVSKKDIKEHFDIYFTDPIFKVSNESVFDADKGSYIKLVIKYSLKNPFKFIEYVFQSSNIVFDITRDSDWTGPVYLIDLEPERDRFYDMFNQKPLANYDNATSKHIGRGDFDNLMSYADYFSHNLVLDTLFDSPAFYMYISFILLGFLYVVTRSKAVFLIYLPNLLNIVTVVISTPYQGNRYLYSNLLVFYLLLIILVKLWSDGKFKDFRIKQ